MDIEDEINDLANHSVTMPTTIKSTKLESGLCKKNIITIFPFFFLLEKISIAAETIEYNLCNFENGIFNAEIMSDFSKPILISSCHRKNLRRPPKLQTLKFNIQYFLTFLLGLFDSQKTNKNLELKKYLKLIDFDLVEKYAYAFTSS